MKKGVLFLVFALILGILAGCSGDAVGNPAEKSAVSADDGTVIELVAANSFSTNDMGSLVFAYWCDKVEELSGGTIHITQHLGGTLCSMPEEFNLMTSGSVDMICVLPDLLTNQIPLAAYALEAGDSQKEIVDIYNDLLLNNPETAPLIQAQAEAAGAVILGTQAGGINAACATKDFSSFEDLSKMKFGAQRDPDLFASIGMNNVSADPTTAYDSLSRGVYDATILGFSSGIIAGKYYEVAPYVGILGGYSVANHFMMNLNTWNSLTEEQQGWISQAALDASAYSVELSDKGNEEGKDLIVESGGTLFELGDDAFELYFVNKVSIVADTLRVAAENLDSEEDMNTVIRVTCEKLGAEYPEP